MRPLELYQLKRDGPCPCVFAFKARALTKGACCRFLNLACSREPGRLIPRIGEKVEDLLNRSLDEDLTLRSSMSGEGFSRNTSTGVFPPRRGCAASRKSAFSHAVRSLRAWSMPSRCHRTPTLPLQGRVGELEERIHDRSLL
jgi:hypothetical protein